jgi:urease gamma subunit
MKKNEQLLQDEVASLQRELQEKRIRLTEAGSIADAAVSITDVFSAAQNAADLYLHEISCMKAETEKECAQMIEEAQKAVDKIFADGRKQCEELSTLYEMQAARCRQIQEETENEKQI